MSDPFELDFTPELKVFKSTENSIEIINRYLLQVDDSVLERIIKELKEIVYYD